MIRFDDVTFRYAEASGPTLEAVTLEIPEGELCVVVGETGTGKSTLLRSVNGLVPHFSGGTLAGNVTVDGRSTRDHRPRELADIVGYVGQNPLASFVTERVEDELAYTMENLGVVPEAMRRRVEDTIDLLGLQDLRDRPLRTLSGGQQQRVAIGAVLTASPRVLVLDEPTSALDPAAAEEVLNALARLVHDLGLTVLMAEHRLERVLPFADRLVLVPGGAAPLVAGPPQDIMRHATGRATHHRAGSTRRVGSAPADGTRRPPQGGWAERADRAHAPCTERHWRTMSEARLRLLYGRSRCSTAESWRWGLWTSRSEPARSRC